MVSTLDSGSSGQSLSPDLGHCIVLLGKTLTSQCLSTPRHIVGTGKFTAEGNPVMD